jgi:hypothetical protein
MKCETKGHSREPSDMGILVSPSFCYHLLYDVLSLITTWQMTRPGTMIDHVLCSKPQLLGQQFQHLKLSHLPEWCHPRTQGQGSHFLFLCLQKFIDSRHNAIKQPYGSLLSDTRGVDARAKCAAFPTWHNTNSLSASSWVTVIAQTYGTCDPAVPAVNICQCRWLVQTQTSDAWQPTNTYCKS